LGLPGTGSLFNPDLTPAGNPDLNGRAAKDTKEWRAAEMGAVGRVVDRYSKVMQTSSKRVQELLN